MPFPPLNEHGLLPAGIYEATWGEMEAVFLVNPHRERLYRDIRRFFDQELPPRAAELKLILGGSFFSDKSLPDDVEATLYTPVHPDFLDLLALGTRNEHDRIRASYRLDFYLTPLVIGYHDFGDFFQYVGPKTAAAKGLHEKDKRGVIQVKPWKLG